MRFKILWFKKIFFRFFVYWRILIFWVSSTLQNNLTFFIFLRFNSCNFLFKILWSFPIFWNSKILQNFFRLFDILKFFVFLQFFDFFLEIFEILCWLKIFYLLSFPNTSKLLIFSILISCNFLIFFRLRFFYLWDFLIFLLFNNFWNSLITDL